MKFKCEKCGTRYTIADEKVRSRVLKIRCKVCEHVIEVRDPESSGLMPVVGGGGAKAKPSPARGGSLARSLLADQFPSEQTSAADPLGPIADVEWYLSVEATGQEGPMPIERLRDMLRGGKASGEDFVWNESMTDWLPAKSVPELEAVFRPAGRPATRPPAPAPPTAPLPPPMPAMPAFVPAATEVVSPAKMALAAKASVQVPSAGPQASAPVVVPSSLPHIETLVPSPPRLSSRPPMEIDLLSLLSTSAAVPAEVRDTRLEPATAGVIADSAIKRDSAGLVASFGLDAEHDIRSSGSATAIADVLPPVGSFVSGAAARRGASAARPPWVIMAVAGSLLLALGIGFGVWLAPKGTVESVAVAVEVKAEPPSAAPPVAVVVAQAAVEPPEPPVSPHSAAPEPPSSGARPRPRVASTPSTTAPKPSSFAALDEGRAPNVPVSSPTVRPIAATESLPEGLSQGQISAVIKQNRTSLTSCYQRQLKRDDSFANARATLRFRVFGDGKARDVTIEKKFDGTLLRQCLVQSVERLAFPPFDGDPIPIEFPLIFQAAL